MTEKRVYMYREKTISVNIYARIWESVGGPTPY
jgi:hypothetical protein